MTGMDAPQEGLDAITNLVRGSAVEGFGAVTTLQQKCLTSGCSGKPIAKTIHFASEHERRLGRKLRLRCADRVSIGPRGLLLRLECAIRVELRKYVRRYVRLGSLTHSVPALVRSFVDRSAFALP